MCRRHSNMCCKHRSNIILLEFHCGALKLQKDSFLNLFFLCVFPAPHPNLSCKKKVRIYMPKKESREKLKKKKVDDSKKKHFISRKVRHGAALFLLFFLLLHLVLNNIGKKVRFKKNACNSLIYN